MIARDLHIQIVKTLIVVNITSLYYSVMKSVVNSFTEMSSLATLKRHLGTKTTFENKYIKANMFEFL